MFHAYAFISQLVVISNVGKLVVMNKFEEELFLRTIQEYKVRLHQLSVVVSFNIDSAFEIWSSYVVLS